MVSLREDLLRLGLRRASVALWGTCAVRRPPREGQQRVIHPQSQRLLQCADQLIKGQVNGRRNRATHRKAATSHVPWAGNLPWHQLPKKPGKARREALSGWEPLYERRIDSHCRFIRHASALLRFAVASWKRGAGWASRSTAGARCANIEPRSSAELRAVFPGGSRRFKSDEAKVK